MTASQKILLINTTDILHQEGSSQFNRHGIETGFGFDWTYKRKNNFSGSLDYNALGHTWQRFD